jgi:SAM-dependent methyltransferase
MVSKIGKHWNKVGNSYNKYWRSPGKQALLQKELNFISGYLNLSKPGRALDIGIGTGRILGNYLKQSLFRYIDGIDISQTMVDLCRKKFSGNKRVNRLAVCDISAQKLPFPLKYDFITMIRVLKYTRNWKKVVAKVAASLNNGGIFIFSIPNANSYIRFTRPETKEYYSTIKEIQTFLAPSKLRILEIASFSKIPDTVYNLADNHLSLSWLTKAETILECIGKNIGGKELFVAAQKKITPD